MSALVVAHPPARAAERAYAIAVVLEDILGLEHVAVAEEREDVRIRMAGDDERSVRVADGLLGIAAEDWLTAAALPRRPLAWLDTRDSGLDPVVAEARLPVLYGDDPPVVARSGEGWRLGVDVFGSAFFMLTRYEEAVGGDRDAHERFPAAASVAVAEGFIERPVVHEYAELLWSALRATWPGLERPRRTPGLRPSHDVDTPRLPRRSAAAVARSLAGDLVRRRDPRLAADRARWELGLRRGRLASDPYDTYDELMDLSEAAGTHSAFYFMAGVTHPGVDGDYALDDPWIAALLRRIHERGHEIGLHPSYGSLGRPDVVAREFAALRSACAAAGVERDTWGGRQHYLRWATPASWQAWDDAGLDYDSTLTFAERAGFRTGACVDYPAFNLHTGRRLRVRERPLVVMEGSLLDYAGLTHAQAEDVIVRLRDRCRRFGGDFTLLWHNDNLLSRRDRDLYRRIMRASSP